MEVWFNPSCSKCRIARDQLDEAGVACTLRRYLDEPLARELKLRELPRDADAWIRVLAEHPHLIQRPLVLTDDGRAWVARDDETRSEVVAAGRRTDDRT